jgi:hypothetical protein
MLVAAALIVAAVTPDGEVSAPLLPLPPLPPAAGAQ